MLNSPRPFLVRCSALSVVASGYNLSPAPWAISFHIISCVASFPFRGRKVGRRKGKDQDSNIVLQPGQRYQTVIMRSVIFSSVAITAMLTGSAFAGSKGLLAMQEFAKIVERQSGAFIPPTSTVNECASDELECGRGQVPRPTCYTPSIGQICCSDGREWIQLVAGNFNSQYHEHATDLWYRCLYPGQFLPLRALLLPKCE